MGLVLRFWFVNRSWLIRRLSRFVGRFWFWLILGFGFIFRFRLCMVGGFWPIFGFGFILWPWLVFGLWFIGWGSIGSVRLRSII